MMLKTYLGPVEDESGLHYLRPETAQGIFVNFANVVQTSRKKPPFGIGQIGKSFRNEITPGNFIFRTREFEQMEMEFFVEPGTDEEWHQYWIDERTSWYVDLGIEPDNLRHFEHPKEKLSHYSKRTVDIEYRFGFAGSEWGELEGIANRTDFDLKTHTKHSGTDLSYFDQANNERWTPYVIEPAAGLTRSLMAFLVEAYTEDEAPNTKGGVDKRTVLKLDPRLAPVKAAVLPLSRNEALSPKARDLAAELRKHWNVDFDDAQAIGRRYRRQDEIGTPFCITVDFDTLEDHAVTIRERDTMIAGAGQPGQGDRVPGDASGGLLIPVTQPPSAPARAGSPVGDRRLPSALASSGSRQTRHAASPPPETQRSVPTVASTQVQLPARNRHRPRRAAWWCSWFGGGSAWRVAAGWAEGGYAGDLGADGGDHECGVPAAVPGAGGGWGGAGGAQAGLFVCEMITSRGIVERDRKTRDMLQFDPGERVRSVQLYGVDPVIMGRATEILINDFAVDHVDLNFGCPVPKVTRKGGGAALPYKRRWLELILTAVVGAATPYGVPVTMKTRIGIDHDHQTHLDAGRIAEQAGCAAIALHGRTAAAGVLGRGGLGRDRAP